MGRLFLPGLARGSGVAGSWFCGLGWLPGFPLGWVGWGWLISRSEPGCTRLRTAASARLGWGGGGGLGAAGLHLHGLAPPLFDNELNRTGGRALLTRKDHHTPERDTSHASSLHAARTSTGFFLEATPTWLYCSRRERGFSLRGGTPLNWCSTPLLTTYYPCKQRRSRTERMWRCPLGNKL